MSINGREEHEQTTKKQQRGKEEIKFDTKRTEGRADTQERGAEVDGSWVITRRASSTTVDSIRSYTNEAYVMPGHIRGQL